MAQTIKNLPAKHETWAWSLSWEDPLENGMAIQSSILMWKIPWTEEPGKLQSRVTESWKQLTRSLSLFFINQGLFYQVTHVGDVTENTRNRLWIWLDPRVIGLFHFSACFFSELNSFLGNILSFQFPVGPDGHQKPWSFSLPVTWPRETRKSVELPSW